MTDIRQWFAVIIVLSASAAATQGQPPGVPATPTMQPPISPYLNLARRGGSPALNYYGLVRPEQEFRSAYRGLQSQADLQGIGGADSPTALPTTGHSAVFLNTGNYFMTLSPALGQSRLGTAAMGPRTGGQSPAAPRAPR